MREIDTAIDIDASASRVWAILTDFERYPEWNPFIPRIQGRPEPGARLEVRIAPPGRSAMTFKPIVQAAVPERELRAVAFANTSDLPAFWSPSLGPASMPSIAR